MKVAVCIPYRAGIPERDRNFAYVESWWREELGWPVFLGDDTADEAFSIGRSRNLAAEQAGDWDVAVFTDADMVPGSHAQVEKAVASAWKKGSYTTLHSEIRYTDEAVTAAVCADELELSARNVPHAVGGVWIPCCALRRDLFDAVGGYDRRIHGYGGEDLAMYFAAATLAGAVRTEGPLYHLQHPESPDWHRLDGTWTVVNQYSGAKFDREAMLQVIAGNK